MLLLKSDARALPLRDESVQCVLTSPPYWGLRDYGVEGQLGAERNLVDYVDNIVAVFAEVWRVLRPDGIAWLVIGDSYIGSWGNYAPRTSGEGGQRGPRQSDKWHRGAYEDLTRRPANSLKQEGLRLKRKDLACVPWRVGMALQEWGWYLRSPCIWAKDNPMPESVEDRPTASHEYVLLLAKSQRYFYDGFAIREEAARKPVQTRTKVRAVQGRENGDKQRGHSRRHAGFNDCWDLMTRGAQQSTGRNKRDVWRIPTQPLKLKHYAAFPEALAEICIAAGSSERGMCPNCGTPWERVLERTQYDTERYQVRRALELKAEHGLTQRHIAAIRIVGLSFEGKTKETQKPWRKADLETRELAMQAKRALGSYFRELLQAKPVTVGWRPACACYDDLYRALPEPRKDRKRERRSLWDGRWRRVRARPGSPDWKTMPSVVFDPFSGSGTTVKVAENLGRNGVGGDLGYHDIARERIAELAQVQPVPEPEGQMTFWG